MRSARAFVVGMLSVAVGCKGAEGPPAVASVTVTPAAATVEVGLTTQLSASVRDAGGSALTNPVDWSSGAPAIASVTGTGLVTGVAVGSATITATSAGKQATASVSVIPRPVATVAVTLAATTVEQGRTTQASAVLRDAGNNVLSGRDIAWTSSNLAIASVSPAGLVTALTVGTASIIATSEGKTGTAAITVILRPVNTVIVTLTPTSLVVGTSGQATFVARDVDGNTLTGRTATWSSSNQQVATVNATTGAVTAVAAGQANITATVEGRTGAAAITVIPPPVNTVTVTLTPTSLVAGTGGQATFVARDVAGNVLTGRTATWSSSNQPVATVNATTGAITAVAAGQANIIATVEGKNGSAQLTVTPVVAFGTVTGLVTAADGTTPIADALVEVETTAIVSSARLASAAPSTRTALNGTYTLQNVPSGPQVIVATRGVFQSRVNVNVQANQSVAAPNAALTSTGRLAFVRGSFDSIEDIVLGALGNPIEEIMASDLVSSAVTSRYRMIFLNCGLDTSPLFFTPAVVTNLRTFLQNGGTIYASDWADEYVAALFTGFSYQHTGDAQSSTATVVDASLQAFVGKTSVAIVYDLDAWSDLSAIPATATVLLRGNYTAGGIPRTNQPMAIVIPQGSGRLVFTTFHNEAGATADQIAVLRHFIYLP